MWSKCGEMCDGLEFPQMTVSTSLLLPSRALSVLLLSRSLRPFYPDPFRCLLALLPPCPPHSTLHVHRFTHPRSPPRTPSSPPQPLSIASRNGHVASVHALLKAGAEAIVNEASGVIYTLPRLLPPKPQDQWQSEPADGAPAAASATRSLDLVAAPRSLERGVVVATHSREGSVVGGLLPPAVSGSSARSKMKTKVGTETERKGGDDEGSDGGTTGSDNAEGADDAAGVGRGTSGVRVGRGGRGGEGKGGATTADEELPIPGMKEALCELSRVRAPMRERRARQAAHGQDGEDGEEGEGGEEGRGQRGRRGRRGRHARILPGTRGRMLLASMPRARVRRTSGDQREAFETKEERRRRGGGDVGEMKR